MLGNDIKLVIAAASLRNDNGIEAEKTPFITEHSSAAARCECVCRSIFESAFMALTNYTVRRTHSASRVQPHSWRCMQVNARGRERV